MLKISYKVKEILPNIFAVIVPNGYTRAMLFLRIQEFYESKNKKFRGKSFSFWEYKKWYSSINKEKFTYTGDWSGFNVPFEVAMECKNKSKIETPYDTIMNNILINIKKTAKNSKSYLIGVESLKSEIFKHELSHALYYTNNNYKSKMDNITKLIKPACFNSIKKYLMKKGYCKEVILDEIQAYLATSKKNILSKKLQKSIIKKYKDVFKEEYKKLIFS